MRSIFCSCLDESNVLLLLRKDLHQSTAGCLRRTSRRGVIEGESHSFRLFKESIAGLVLSINFPHVTQQRTRHAKYFNRIILCCTKGSTSYNPPLKKSKVDLIIKKVSRPFSQLRFMKVFMYDGTAL